MRSSQTIIAMKFGRKVCIYKLSVSLLVCLSEFQYLWSLKNEGLLEVHSGAEMSVVLKQITSKAEKKWIREMVYVIWRYIERL